MDKTKFNLDHVYCHTNESNYFRANAGSSDVMAIIKENKQLKAMLLLHLDLIQEQSDQIMAKEKQLATLREENEMLKLRIERMERRVSLRSAKSPSPMVVSNSPSPPVQTEDRRDSIRCAVPAPRLSPLMPYLRLASPLSIVTTPTPSESKYKISETEINNIQSSIIGENNGKFISKIILQRVQISPNAVKNLSIKCEEMNDELSENHTQSSPLFAKNKPDCEVAFQEIKKEVLSSPEVEENEKNKVPADAKEVPNDTEDSFSCGSLAGDRDSTVALRPNQRKNSKRNGFMTTKKFYCTREWAAEEDEYEEVLRDESEALKAEDPNLEIPKWTIKEFTGVYSIEGTEDLSDDTFLKRHSKLEMDEKRRKKWDVQRIREQRTIERLKKRHYKELVPEESSDLTSFYPGPDSVKFIEVTEDIPVQAFGESIPCLQPPIEFTLPWHCEVDADQIIAPLIHQTSLTFIKKRRRQSSQNLAGASNRSRKRKQSITVTFSPSLK